MLPLRRKLPLEATARAVSQQEYFCQADAEAAAAKLRAQQSAYHAVEVRVEAHPKYGPGRPSQKQPRVIKALRYGLQVTLRERAEVIARRTQETGCFVLLTNVPTVGEMAHTARDVLRAYKAQHGICLLYTSPSPRDGLLSRMPSSA